MRIPVIDPSMRQFVLELPWTEFTNKKKSRRKSLNLNLYRNLHFQELSNQKNHFHDRMVKTLGGIPSLGSVWLHYEIHPNHRGRLDTMNVGSVEDKFFSDSLTELGIIEDDDYTHVVFNSFCFGSVVSGDAFVRVFITELEPRKQQNMRVLLDEDDIQKALETFVSNAGINGATGVKLSIENGQITAEVLFGIQGPRVTTGTNVPMSEDDDDDDLPKPKSRGGRPAGSKNKPKDEVTNNVGTSDQGGSGRDAEGTGQTGGSSSDEDDDDFLKPKPKGGARQNPSEDSPEESSNNDDADAPEKGEDVPDEKPVRKSRSSIFDDD